jgi:hypothetical protein
MASRPALVTDTNIWIDLENGGIVAEVFRLPYQFVVPDFAILELRRPRWETLAAFGLDAHGLQAEQVAELARLRQTRRNLSVTDLAAFLLAHSLGAALLTGDRRLHELAHAEGLVVHGVLWLLDEMVHWQALTSGEAAEALRRMLDQGARLPADECSDRFARWSG